MKSSYTFIDHTADMLFKAQAPALNELFRQCALALEDIQVNIKLIKPKLTTVIKGRNKQIDRLLFDFLDDLIFYKDSELLIFSEFKIQITEKNHEFALTCLAKGEKLDHQKHEPKVDAKAITMHLFEVKKTAQGWTAQVLVDI